MKRRISIRTKITGRYLFIMALLWTALVLLSLYWNWHQVEKSTMALAVQNALSSFKKDIVYRLWNSNHGGVYVKVTDQTPPNPFLEHTPERDIITPSGIKFTLINPAYMTRQVHKLGQQKYGFKAHITSLNPIREANAADEWETKALESFEKGVREFVSEEVLDEESYLRFMRPLFTEKSCLKCHAIQGYKEGDIRGGISVSIPLKSYHKAAMTGQLPLLYVHILIWILGIAGILSGNAFLRRAKTARRLEFEHIVGQISSNFVKLAPGKTKKGVEHALAAIGDYMGIDRIYIFRLREDETLFNNTHKWISTDITDRINPPDTIAFDNTSGWLTKLKNSEMVIFSNLSDMPEIIRDRKTSFVLKNTKSLIAVPLLLNNRLMGFLGADTVIEARIWSDEDIMLLQLAGKTIGYALDRDQAEKALASQTERLNRILHSTNVGTWEWNIQTGDIIINDRWAEIAGYTTEEISPVTEEMWNQLYHPDDKNTTGELLRECLDYKKTYYNCEARVQHKNGRWVWIQDRGKIVTWTDKGDPEWMYGTRTDITLQKEQEQERRKIFEQLQQTQRLESMGVMAGGIAHDFNNILTTIMGNAELALGDLPSTEPGRHNIIEILNASKNAADLCSQMLAYAGKGILKKQNISLNNLIKNTISMLKTSISKKDILHLDISENIPPVHADPTQVRQILMNLVINASEAIGEPGGYITISTGTADHLKDTSTGGYVIEPVDKGTHVFFEVSDNGQGFEKELIQRIFEPFFTTKFIGRGLGLSAVAGIVSGHNGALYVHSDPGKGTVFRIFFPVAAVTSEQSADTNSKREKWQGRGTVMLVDDEDSVRSVTINILQRLGLDVIAAADGFQAIDMYRRQHKDIGIVLLDLTMPRMNGVETYRELKKINPDVCVILASGYSKDIVSLHFTDQELVYSLQKPYTIAKLRSLLSILMPDTGLKTDNPDIS